MVYDSEYWANRIESATTLETLQLTMRLRDAALHRHVVDTFNADGYMPSGLRRKQHLQRHSKGKRVCGRMRGRNGR